MKVAIPKEITPNERRVALVPALTQELIQLGCTILLEKDAGLNAYYRDDQYQNVEICPDAASLYQDADIIFKVRPLTENEITLCKKGSVVIGFLFPGRYPTHLTALRDQSITSFAIELIPRISRAQTMDALSSQATVSGYKAALIAANMAHRFFPMLTTAAGTIRPAKVLVIGTGVAGLQAIATARRLGAIVKASDIRSSTREQVESLGAKMINVEIKADSHDGYARELTADERKMQQDVLANAIAEADIIITTAQIPGKSAPLIVSREMVELMQPGAVIIDAAAETGGNCELTEADKIVEHHGVVIYGPINLPSLVARDASNMYAKNLINFLKLLIKDGKLDFAWEDPILAASVCTHEGIIKYNEKQDK